MTNFKLACLALVLSGVALFVVAFAVRAQLSGNPVQIENSRPGTSDWRLTSAASNHEIEGYASKTSVNRGGQIEFFVNTTDPSYSLEIFRVGWYGGLGARQMTAPVTLAGVQQSVPAPDPTTGIVDCNWTAPYTITTTDPSDPSKWLSGVYLVKLTGTTSGKQSYIIFVVREDSRPSDILVQQPVTTSQAYNAYGGTSLYTSNSTNFVHAVNVSFNRPYDHGWGTGLFLSYEFDGFAFLEEEGYDVTYSTSIDTHESASNLLLHKVFLTVGHDEYWSWEMRQNVQHARDSGVSLGFMSANESFWKIRFQASTATGDADRVVVCYKDDEANSDPDASDPATYYLVTVLWREPYLSWPGSPEDGLIGEMSNLDDGVNSDVIISSLSPSWVFANTGLLVGSRLPGLLGYEVDQRYDDASSPPDVQVVTHSPYVSNGSTHYGDMTVYTTTSGSTVYAFGTIQWTWGLTDISTPWGPSSPLLNGGAQQITRNVLNQLVSTSSITSASPTPTVAPTPTPTPRVSAVVKVSKSFLNFGTVRIGKSKVKVVKLTNTAKKKGGATVTFNGASVSGSTEFSASTSCNGQVGPKGRCSVMVGFVPSSSGAASATVTIGGNASNSPQSFGVTGIGK
jgi:hypothetical protein